MLLFLMMQNLMLFGQSSGLEEEKEVKISGNYFWSQVTAPSDLEAKNQALELLWTNKELIKTVVTNPNLNQNNVSYILKKRGNKVLAIAYIGKNVTTKKIEIATQHVVIVEPEKLNETNQNSNTDNEKDIKTSEKVEIKNEALSDISVNKTKQLSDSVIINSLLDIEDFNNMLKELNTFKVKGKLMYSSRIDAFDNINQCYIIICKENTTKISYILDKGSDIRVNLLDSQKIKIKENQLINQLQKIYVYEF